MIREQADAIGLAVGKVGTYGGGTSAFVFGLTANELAAVVGVVVAVVGLIVQFYFSRRRDRREQAEHEARMRQLQSGAAKPASLALGATVAAVLAVAAPLVMKWEGVRYTAYQDSAGVWTICYGHTKGVTPGMTATRAQCEAWLQEDMAEANAHVRRCIGVPMLRHIEAALTSATFNLGPKVVCGSTLQSKAVWNDWPGACAELDRWKYAGGRELRGLVLRRADERALCEGRALWGGES